jgi:hypothetical protein
MNQWISIEDRLPEGSGEVLVARKRKEGKRKGECRVTVAEAHRVRERHPHDLFLITHWMPFPPPPEETE